MKNKIFLLQLFTFLNIISCALEEPKIKKVKKTVRFCLDPIQNRAIFKSAMDHIKDSCLPTIEDILDNQIDLKTKEKIILAQNKPSNILIISGPSGNGKTTLANLIGRLSKREIICDNAQPIDELFKYAKSKDKPVLIIIEKFDQVLKEQNNKSILKKYFNRPNIFIIGIIQKNYPLNNIPVIKLENPNYEKRIAIIKYYLQKNKIDYNIRGKNFISAMTFMLLGTATQDFSCLDLKKVINNAITYLNTGFDSEEIPESFRDNFIDLDNRPISSLFFGLQLSILNKYGILGLISQYTNSKIERHLVAAFHLEKSNLKSNV